MTAVPIVFIIFRRPEATRRVFDAIARVKPKTLLIVADGPRDDRPGEADACAATRAVVERIDWDCAVLRNYADVNLGCGQRPATGITWAFEHVDEAVILEDDCLPDPTFVQFAEEMLERYRDDKRVMFVSGANFCEHTGAGRDSYRFSRMGPCFGAWATWGRAWRMHDMAVRDWPAIRHTGLLESVIEDDRVVAQWHDFYDAAYSARGAVNYWDYQWALAVWSNSGLAIVPRTNLVSNIGFGPGATHTHDADDPFGRLQIVPLEFPLLHPKRVCQDLEADRRLMRDVLLPRSIPRPLTLRTRVRDSLSDLLPLFVKRVYRAFAGDRTGAAGARVERSAS